MIQEPQGHYRLVEYNCGMERGDPTWRSGTWVGSMLEQIFGSYVIELGSYEDD